MRAGAVALFAVVLGLVITNVAHAATFPQFSANRIFLVVDADGDLANVKTATGEMEFVGKIDVAAIDEFTNDEITDISYISKRDKWNIYAIGKFGFYVYDLLSGRTTFLGPHGVGPNPSFMNALTVGDDGRVYAAQDGLYTVDRATGVASLVGATGYVSSGDLAFSRGRLFLTAATPTGDQLLELDPATGAVLSAVALPVRNVFGISAPGSLRGGPELFGVAANQFYLIDAPTGRMSTAGLADFADPRFGEATGMAFAPVPLPGAAPMILTGLAGLVWASRRRRPPSAA